MIYWLKAILIIFAIMPVLWLILETGVRIYVDSPLKTDFYSSIPGAMIPQRQKEIGVQVVTGAGWIHLGWIANPNLETYRIEENVNGGWQKIGQVEFGSFLVHGAGGAFRVVCVPKDGSNTAILGEVNAMAGMGNSAVYVPRIAGEWQFLFKPQESGDYVNDHAVFQDAEGRWRLVGITSKTNGDFNQERYFATAVSADFPPANGMTETTPIADFGELAWAPFVLNSSGSYHMFWSPHKLHEMTSKDGIFWGDHQITLPAPYHKFFRDPMVIQVAGNQWLLYTTARGLYYSQVDIYQSFDLIEWQYIGTALHGGWGSERNSPFSSMESPYVTAYHDHYYLSVTYNNDSFFWPGILLMFQIWPDPASYNDTLVFHADNPYDFGTYRGRQDSPTLLTLLKTHAAEVIYNPDDDKWYITTAGWPWVTTLTSGEVAVAPLEWQAQSGGMP